jgi:hypothetical protein
MGVPLLFLLDALRRLKNHSLRALTLESWEVKDPFQELSEVPLSFVCTSPVNLF